MTMNSADNFAGSMPRIRDPGVVRRTLADRILGAVFVVFPSTGTVVLLVYWSNLQPTLWDISVAATLYLMTGIGITAGYHRMAAHRSFEPNDFVKKSLLALGSMAFQGPIARWVADHRRHHAFADAPGDPHTPCSNKNWITGFFWSHVGWLFSQHRTRVSKFAPDVIRDPIAMGISRNYLLLTVLSLVIPTVLGGVFRFSAAGFLTGFLLGGCARICLFQHATWTVNSVAHFSGKRRHETGDQSTNNSAVAFFTFGEGWHNNHHAAPCSARHGGSGQWDVTYLLIAALRRIGAVKNVRDTKLF